MINVKKLLIATFTMATIICSHQLSAMEQQSYAQLSPITLPQTYLHLSEILLPEIAQHIFSLQLHASNVNFAELTLLIEQNYKRSYRILPSIRTLLNSCGHDLATGIFKQALSHAKISICDIKDERDWTPLHQATDNGHIKIIKLLLEIAGDRTWSFITAQDKINNWSVLYLAACKGQTEICELLIKAAGDKAWSLIADEHETALHVAVSSNWQDVAKLLINTAGDRAWMLITARNNVLDGYTALHDAAERGHTEMVKLLLDTAGNNAQEFIDMLNDHKKTAFDIATPEVKEIMKKYMVSNTLL